MEWGGGEMLTPESSPNYQGPTIYKSLAINSTGVYSTPPHCFQPLNGSFGNLKNCETHMCHSAIMVTYKMK
jgi:hypothetical protein